MKNVTKITTMIMVLLLAMSFQITAQDVISEGTVELTGYVKDLTTNDPVAEAFIIIGDLVAVTDGEGFFETLINLESQINGSIQITKEGYANYQKPLSMFLEGGEYKTEFLLKPVDVLEVIDPSQSNTITAPDGASIKLPELPEIDENLIVGLTSFNVSTNDVLAAPGDFSAIDGNGDSVSIVSQGMIDVTFTGEISGTQYTLEGMGPFTITIPVSGNQETALDIIDAWYFDESLGLWVQQGELIREGDSYVSDDIEFMATWNADYPTSDPTSITGEIIEQTSAGYYLTEVYCQGWSHEFYSPAVPFTIIQMPQNTYMFITVTNLNTGEAHSKTFTTNNDSTCLDIGTFVFTGTSYIEIIAPFEQNGAGEFYFKTTTIPFSVNSWNLDLLEINGVDFTNTWAYGSSLPAKIGGYYYIHYTASYSWSHFEIQ